MQGSMTTRQTVPRQPLRFTKALPHFISLTLRTPEQFGVIGVLSFHIFLILSEAQFIITDRTDRADKKEAFFTETTGKLIDLPSLFEP